MCQVVSSSKSIIIVDLVWNNDSTFFFLFYIERTFIWVIRIEKFLIDAISIGYKLVMSQHSLVH